MPDTPTPSEHDPLVRALLDARADVTPMSGDSLVNAARNAKVARARHRRRTRGGVIGAAAVLALVTVAAVALQSRSSSQVVQVGKQSSYADSVAFGVVGVTPSTGLVDGQTVTVSASGFDPGSPVNFIECTPVIVDPGSPTADGPPVPDATERTVEPQRGRNSSSVDGNEQRKPMEAPSDVIDPGATAPGAPKMVPGAPPSSGSDEALPGWWCDGPPGAPGPHAFAEATADLPRDSALEREGGKSSEADVTRATTKLRVVSSTDGFVARSHTNGAFSISPPIDESVDPPPAQPGPSGRCVNPQSTPPSPAADAPSAEPAESGSSFPRAPTTFTASSEETSTSPAPDPAGACVVIAVGKVDGKPMMFSSRALSFADTTSVPSTTPPVTSAPPSSIAPPGTDPCPPGAMCSAPVDPSDTAPTSTSCPTSPPLASPMDGDHTSPLLDFTPTSITVCHIPAVELGPPPLTISDRPTISRITAAIKALRDVPGAHTACTMEMGDTMVLVAEDGSKRTVIAVQFYGCRVVSNGTTIRLGAESLRWINELPPSS